MKIWLFTLLLFTSRCWAIEPMTVECQQAFAALKTHIDQRSASITQAELESSVAADQIRFACDGSPAAYQHSVRQIAQRFIAPPSVAKPDLSDTAADLVTLAMIIALITTGSNGISFTSADGSLSIIAH
ncbi:hypothetical protein HZU75_09620 [Chitinibacter fontanus]|uniref:Uncharacterized protein n=1 Tax=Chitinibacter fontanus TaxID=1737446 RepID=A0A7D5V9X0_9NEIS|nr:hypothetical protein [Chitinibacter fontanus]QLI81771.1 hypothetical protein HZU75_09620 [Chitinibacter fontanus]